jgi:shikimate kinase
VSPAASAWLESVLEKLDPRVRDEVRRSALATADDPPGLPSSQVVLVGQRASGKSVLLPLLAPRLRLPAFDLDREMEHRHGRRILEWFTADAAGFRQAEREIFLALPPSCVVAAGGGFLFHHADLLGSALAVWVPVSLETYRERMRADVERPRLRPDVSLEDELTTVFWERERSREGHVTWPLGRLLAAVAP